MHSWASFSSVTNMNSSREFLLLCFIFAIQSEIIIPPEVHHRDDALAFTISIEEAGPMVQFSKIGHLSFKEGYYLI